MAKLSVVISAHNEEKNIKDCLESANQLGDEIILIDNNSTDKTQEIGREYGAKIYTQPNNLMLNINKNFGFEKASGDWILNLDADERVTPELRDEIVASIKDQVSSVDGYWIPRKNIIFGKWIQHSLWSPDEQLRLFRKGKGRFPEKHIHEALEINGSTGHLKNPLTHLNYASVSQFLYKLDKIYTENETDVFLRSGKKLKWTDAITWPVEDFLKTFFAQKGYKDGLHGLVLSLLQAFYAEIVFAKIWEKQGFWEPKEEDFLKKVEGEFAKTKKDLNYWFSETYLEETKNPFRKLLLKIKRKLSL